MSRNNRSDVGQRKRRYCFTLNNFTDEELTSVRLSFGDSGRDVHHINYACFGIERGDSGTPHLQGFIAFSNPKSFQSVKGIPGLQRIHLEACRGTVSHNIDYCSKEGNFEEYGNRPLQGSRSDLERVAQLVGEGKSLMDIAEEAPIEFIKFSKGIEKLVALRQPYRQWKTEVYWYYGPTGTGKSKTAFEEAAMANSYYVKDPTGKWWDGYVGQEVVIIDDYRRDFCTFASLLRLFDRYPMSIEFKGGTTQFLGKKIFITTPKDPTATWDTRTSEDIAQLLRRITVVKLFDNHNFNPDAR